MSYEKAKKKNPNELRITNQFRDRESLVYDLKCEDSRLTLSVSPRANAADLGEWRIDARSGGPGAAVVTQWGATRIDALREVGRSWGSATALDGTALPPFDWDAVARVLVAVRAA